ncbi:hypothetical protein PsYK624_053880 [Phanerochaete sordida]|uniref:Uncharacterized protein n=1 Tax=Phanerochaete sordida TaxID=48140 RepID=A0A9P3LBA9_9APHY|nr:hypothetical protein PsYK624_053880 [Phanerochaete sordida]
MSGIGFPFDGWMPVTIQRLNLCCPCFPARKLLTATRNVNDLPTSELRFAAERPARRASQTFHL